jgi:hypothetical protein
MLFALRVRVASGGDERRGSERWEGFQQENRKRRGLFAKSQLVGGVESKNARGGFGWELGFGQVDGN